MEKTAKRQAIKDIREDLKRQSKTFLAFRKELNPRIDNIVKNYIDRQEHEE